MHMKNIEIDIQSSTDNPLKIQKAFWMECIPLLSEKDLCYYNKKLRGNSKVAFHLAYEDIKRK